MSDYDFIVVGAGSAGLPCALSGARAGARVLLVEKAGEIGGTLRVSNGHISAAGTRRQKARGIDDSVEEHFQDVRRISGGAAREDLVSLALPQAAVLVDWLEEEGFEFAPETPRLIDGHGAYSRPRTYYGVEEGRSLLKIFDRLLQPFLTSGAITLVLNARVKALLTDKRKVVGVQFARGGVLSQARSGRGVVLATGGFAASPELFKEIEGFPLVSWAPDESTGDGLKMARGLGARVVGAGTYLPAFGGLPDPAEPHKALWTDQPLFDPKERPPYEIYVNRFGKRWVAEDSDGVDSRERALLTSDDLTFFTVFDDHAVEMSENFIAGWSKADLRERAGRREGVYKAPTLEQLAQAAGVAAEGLAESVVRYNEFVRNQNDRDFGRTFLPAPIAKPPFYAMRHHGVSLVTFSGLDVDDKLRVRGEEGDIIEGLYAAGEILGAGATCGQSFCSGMVLGPALIFGRLLGQWLAAPETAADQTNAPTAEIPRA